METLGKIFGSNHRVKIMRLFLFNEELAIDIDDIVKRTRIKKTDTRKELGMLTKIGFLQKKIFVKKIEKKSIKKNTEPEFKTTKVQGWVLNRTFELVRPLQLLLLESELIEEKDIVTRVKKSGTIKLLVLSGIFIGDDNRAVDILVVGNNLKRDVLNREMAIIESEIGKEISYAYFDQKEFEYRMSMYDKLIRDILENDHKKLVNKIVQ
ncbi:MAG: hypothetical protein ACJAU8_000360 [Candidatus Paceibacteria bacterium]|jgi:hypothetical protein